MPAPRLAPGPRAQRLRLHTVPVLLHQQRPQPRPLRPLQPGVPQRVRRPAEKRLEKVRREPAVMVEQNS